jgi:hypothetical protein
MSNIYYSEGQFSKSQIDEYIKNSMSKKQYKILLNLWKNTDDKIIEFKSIGINNPNGYTYNELFLFDINDNDNKYMPVYVQNINTSSVYALMRLGTNYDDDDDENNFISIDDLKNMIIEGYNINKICDLVISK